MVRMYLNILDVFDSSVDTMSRSVAKKDLLNKPKRNDLLFKETVGLGHLGNNLSFITYKEISFHKPISPRSTSAPILLHWQPYINASV